MCCVVAGCSGPAPGGLLPSSPGPRPAGRQISRITFFRAGAGGLRAGCVGLACCVSGWGGLPSRCRPSPAIAFKTALRLVGIGGQHDPPVLINHRVHQHPLEEDGVELLLEVVGGGSVEPSAVLQQVQGLGQVLADEGGVCLVAVELALDPRDVPGQAGLFLFEQFQGDGAGVVGLEELAALVLQTSTPGGQGADLAGFVGLDALQFGQQIGLDGLAVCLLQVDLPIQLGHPGLDLLDEDRSEGAVVGAVAAGAHEVGVGPAVATPGLVHQQPRATQPTDHGGLQVVVVQALLLTVAVGIQDVLDLLPGLGIDQGLMLAGVLHALEGDDAAVVGMAQQSMQPVLAQGLGRPGGRGGQVQAQAGQVLGQTSHRPVAGGVLGEGQAHERAALRIQLNSADLTSLGILATDIAVAQGRLANGATAAGLLSHALDDLAGQVAGVELGDRAHDAMQQDAARGLVDVLRGGDQANPGLLEGPVDLDIIGPVAGQTVQLMDDDVVHIPRLLEVGQHPLQLRTIRAASRLTTVDKLLDDEGAHGGGLLLIRLTLRRDGEALLRTRPLGLLTSGDPDV